MENIKKVIATSAMITSLAFAGLSAAKPSQAAVMGPSAQRAFTASVNDCDGYAPYYDRGPVREYRDYGPSFRDRRDYDNHGEWFRDRDRDRGDRFQDRDRDRDRDRHFDDRGDRSRDNHDDRGRRF